MIGLTGEELRRRRTAVGMSQEDVAEAVGLKGKHRRQTVSAWEAEGAQITEPMAILLDVVLTTREKAKRRKRSRAKPAAV